MPNRIPTKSRSVTRFVMMCAGAGFVIGAVFVLALRSYGCSL